MGFPPAAHSLEATGTATRPFKAFVYISAVKDIPRFHLFCQAFFSRFSGLLKSGLFRQNGSQASRQSVQRLLRSPENLLRASQKWSFQTERLASEPFERKVLAVGCAHRQHLPLPVSAEGARSQRVQRLLRNPEQIFGSRDVANFFAISILKDSKRKHRIL